MFPILEAGPSLDRAALPAFVVARDGLYLRKRSLLGVSQTKVGRVAHLPEGKEFVDYALPKVPSDLMARAVGFFRAIYRLHKAEAAVLLLWRDGSFDLVIQSMMFSSILDPAVRAAAAAEIDRVLSDSGALLSYDFFVRSPGNPGTRPLRKRELRELFPGYELSWRRVTLAPPLVRLFVPGARPLASALQALRVLDTHALAVLRRTP
jgi:hypothetical protein